jgi:hypothetical protein
MYTDDRLIPVDQMCNHLQREIDETLWEDTNADVSYQERELKWFLSLKHKGILYDTTF